MNYNITVLAGDGIGPDITNSALKILDKIQAKYGFKCNINNKLIGGASIDKFNEALTDDTLKSCLDSDAVLLGAVGGPKWDKSTIRPEQGLLKLRSGMNVFANLRPTIVYDALKNASPLKDEIIANGLDIVFVRELTGGIYFGERDTIKNDKEDYAFDTEKYSREEISRIAKIAFETALKRSKKICSVDKANVLDSSKLWRKVVTEISNDYPQVELSHMYVDNAAMQLVRNPSQFDVILTSNMFGDILSDEASQITGSIGMLPSASLGLGTRGLYEPIHGSAPDIAGKDIANPIATILSVAMMLRYSFNQEAAAVDIENAVNDVLNDSFRTADIAQKGESTIGTEEMTNKILERINM